MKYLKYGFVAIMVSLLLALPWMASRAIAKAPADPRLADLLITNDSENVLLYARLVNGFRAETVSAILAGVPAVFTLHLDVYRERSVIWDKSVIHREIRRSIKYDNLKKTFTIKTNGDADVVTLSDFESAKKAMADFSGIRVAPIASLIKGENYYAEVKVKIDKVQLPFYMEYVFFFVSYWDIETPLYKQRFSY
jgi:hypothetical protein